MRDLIKIVSLKLLSIALTFFFAYGFLSMGYHGFVRPHVQAFDEAIAVKRSILSAYETGDLDEIQKTLEEGFGGSLGDKGSDQVFLSEELDKLFKIVLDTDGVHFLKKK